MNRALFEEQYQTNFLPNVNYKYILNEFYKEIILWFEQGRHDGPIFTNSRGLCANLNRWSSNQPLNENTRTELISEMSRQFAKAGLCLIYPFDERSTDALRYASFSEDSMYNRMYLNPQRLNWPYEKVAEYERLKQTV